MKGASSKSLGVQFGGSFALVAVLSVVLVALSVGRGAATAIIALALVAVAVSRPASNGPRAPRPQAREGPTRGDLDGRRRAPEGRARGARRRQSHFRARGQDEAA